MDMRSAAMGLARMGFYVFPLSPGSKVPTGKGWQANSSNIGCDVWIDWTNADGTAAHYNPGVHAREHVILDVDVPGGSHAVDGRIALAQLGWTGRTFTVRTPSGGLHLYFKKPALEDYSQSDLADGINVRSTGGYVVGPGSWTRYIEGKQVEGWYVIVDDTPPAELPECIRSRLTPAGSAARYDESSYGGQWDAPRYVEWCWRYVNEWAPTATKGSRGRTGLEVAHVLGDHAITKPTALVMLQEWHAAKCDPPEDDENQMEHVLDSAYSGRRKPFGVECAEQYIKAIELPRSVMSITQPSAPRPFEQRVRKSRVRCWEDTAKIPVIPWLVRGKLVRGAITGLVSPPGVGKSTLTLQWACALATGDGSFTGLPQLDNAIPIRSLVVGIEDTIEMMESRLSAACRAFGLDYEEIAEHVHLYSGVSDGDLKLLTKKDRRAMLATAEDAARLQAYVQAHGIGVVIIDPLIELHDGEENDNGEMRRVMGMLRSLATTTQASVVIVHHTRKPPQASSESYAGDQFAGRGASSITAAFRVGLTLFGMGPKDGEKYGIPDDQRGEYVRLDDSKSNWSKMSPYATWFRREEVALLNGETTAVLRPAALSASDDKSAEMLVAEVAALLQPGEPMSTAGLALQLIAKVAAYRDKNERTMRRKLREVFGAGKVDSPRGVIAFAPSGKEGGTLTLT